MWNAKLRVEASVEVLEIPSTNPFDPLNHPHHRLNENSVDTTMALKTILRLYQTTIYIQFVSIGSIIQTEQVQILITHLVAKLIP